MPKLSEKDEEAIKQLQAGWDILFQQAIVISMLPLEEWLQQFEKAEAVAPIVNPTLYRDYLYSHKGEAIKRIIRAAIPLKQALKQALLEEQKKAQS